MIETVGGFILGAAISAPIFYKIGQRVTLKRLTEDIYKAILEAFTDDEDSEEA